MGGTDVLWFVAGFFTRAAIAFASDLTWQWRIARAMRRDHQYRVENDNMRWRVNVIGIVWDDGRGDYDVSDLPTEWSATVVADNVQAAIEYALTEASDTCGSLIEGYESSDVQPVPTARKRH